MRTLPCGDAAILVEVDGLPAVFALAAAVRTADLPGVVDVVPAARTVLITTVPGTDLTALRGAVQRLHADPDADPAAGGTVEIPVVYDGPDLDEVGALTGLGVDGVVEAHTATPWRVAFGGFAPGFAYLAGGDTRLAVTRRAVPRTSVPMGSVGLAGGFSGVYPRSSPGGWQLIGRTAEELWDDRRDPPALLPPGAGVRFVRATGSPRSAPRRPHDPARAGGSAGGRAGIEVLTPGALALVEDLGRAGHAAVGVGRSGAADRAALRLANRLVANPEDAAGIEAVLGGLTVRALRPLTVALAGAPAPADVDGTPMGHHAVIALRAGQVLRLGSPPTGLRTYLAVRGGVAARRLLGSCSTDVLSGIGPARLAAGDVLAVGPEPASFPLVDVAPVGLPTGGAVTLRVMPGPGARWVSDLGSLTTTAWTASARADRVGVRLDGKPLHRTVEAELPTEGMVRGSIQVPPGGEPILFLADHPVTGGYPVVAVVIDADIDRAAQVRPGQAVRFRMVPAPW